MTSVLKGLLVAGFATLLLAAPQANARLSNLGKLQDAKSVQCPSSPCTVEFPASGGGRNTFIETVSCWINVTRNATFKPIVSRMQLNQSNALGVHVFLAPLSVLNLTNTEQLSQVFVSGLDYHVPATSKPQVIVETTTGLPPSGMALICAITGRIDETP